jgi:hypothetical protein
METLVNKNKKYTINEERLLKKAEQMKLRAEWIADKLYVYSGIDDEWYMYEDSGKLILKHKNKKGNKHDLRHEHIQKIYKNADEYMYVQALQKIQSHDRYKLTRTIKNKKMELFSMIENNSIPYIKFN